MEKEPEQKKQRLPDDDRNESTTINFIDVVTKTFEEYSEIKLKWIGYFNRVMPCLITPKDAPILVVYQDIMGIRKWDFYLLTMDEPRSTVIFCLPLEMMSHESGCMPYDLEYIISHAIKPELHMKQLILKYLRGTKYLPKEFIRALGNELLKLPYFLCDTHTEACEQLNDWMDSTQGQKIFTSPVSKPIPDVIGQDNEEKKEEEEFLCVICCDAPPSTCVKPCGHVIVCSDCSIGLRDTADKGRCVQCRVVIESVEDLKTGEITLV